MLFLLSSWLEFEDEELARRRRQVSVVVLSLLCVFHSQTHKAIVNFNMMRSGCRLFILRCFHIFILKIVRHSKRSPVKLVFSPAKLKVTQLCSSRLQQVLRLI